ncbi:SPOR domain-containing protein [Maribrevibacterium harenarium]|uniref:SPOR domain-containing protein n=1 Tax=Maribrevibacterium harenarium TaxID=2589817 RepID=A0A501WZF0_9GAMM|nr:SPOR domain-containing protein [Maribrevibacterium harenarium]TPE54140.1 SPOR domain-containing protein [Maribrevibacterium harenarium]
MAQKRGASPKSRSTNSRKAQAAPKRAVAWWLWLLVPAMVGAFVYFLAQLANLSATNEPAAPVTKPAPVAPKPAPAPQPKPEPAKPKPADTPPSKEKDQFEFYQILQDSEVDTSHVDAYQSTPRGEQDFYYMIQAASFRSSADADRLRAQLILAGLDANIRQTTGDDGRPWYRVVVGPFNSRSEKNRAQDKLVAMDIQSYTYTVKKEQ